MELTADEAWTRILESARSRLPEQSYRTWLAPTEAISLTRDSLIVGAPSDFAVEWIEDKYGPLLDELACQHLGDRFTLSFECRLDAEPQAPSFPDAAELPLTPPVQAAPDTQSPEAGSARCVVGNLNPRYTLDRFVVGGNNQLAHAACQAVAGALGRAYNPLFVYGGVGLGKTHLMHAIGHAVLAGSPARRVAYVPTEQFMNELIAAIQGRRTAAFRHRYRRIDLLLVDDVHFLADKEGTQEEFFHTFNALYDAQGQIVLTSDRPPKEIPGLQERLVSRFEWGLVTDVNAPDFETRVAILQQKAEQDGLSISHDVLAFIADRCRSSVRELEGAIIKLLAYSSLTQRDITVELAQEALARSASPRSAVTPDHIQNTVADAFGVPVDALRSQARSRDITLPRQVAMYLMKSLLDIPYTRIGELFGGRDHSTVIHSVRKVEQQAGQDPAFRERVEALRGTLT